MNTRRQQPPKSSTAVDDEEVNQLLQAAQDELLLNLSVSSHTVSNSDLDPDLARRFLALKSRPSASSVPVSAPAPTTPQQTRSSATSSDSIQGQVDDETKAILGDDLSSRFAALRGSTSSGSPLVGPASGVDRSLVNVEEDEDEDEEEEVEKLLRWAMDAARLDPSPPSDDDVDDVSSSDSDSDSDSDVGNENGKRNSSRKQK